MIQRMDIRQLRSFIAVAEELNFSRAASRLNISQPSLSQQIRLLENTVRVPLLWRTSRQVELTAGGRAFLVEARATITQMDHAVIAAKTQAALSAQNLRLGFVDSAIYGVLPPLIRAFRDRYPEVHLSLNEMPSLQQIEALAEGRIDVGLVYPERAIASVAFKQLRRERILLAMPPDHPLAKRMKIPLHLLDGVALVSFERRLAPPIYDRMTKMLAGADASPQIVQTAPELHALVGLVAAGLGVAFVPSSLQNWSGLNVVYRPLSHPIAWVSMSLAWSRAHHSPLIGSLVSVASDQMDHST
jgi:DNA-binding transcriptional LysR family regulator